MKIYTLTLALILTSTFLCNVSIAQDVTTDSIQVDREDDNQKDRMENTLGKSDQNDDSEIKYPRVYGGITFSRIDWGFSRILDNGSFNLSEQNADFLSYGRASNFGFDVAQFGVRFNDNFKVYTAAGFEWNYLRLKQNVLLTENESPINYTHVDPNEVNYKKNVLTTTYLRVPLTFEWRSAKLRSDNRVKIAFGPILGILLKGTQRVKSEELGKQKFRDNYSLQSFQYGGVVRIGYDEIGLFAKYYMNDFFEKSPNQKGLNNLAFGLTLGF